MCFFQYAHPVKARGVRVHGIAQRCLEPIKRRRAEIRDLVAELETGDPAPQPNTDMTPDLEAQPQPIHPI